MVQWLPGQNRIIGDRKSRSIPAGPTTETQDLPRSSRKLNFRPDERTVHESVGVKTKTIGNLRSMRDRSRRDDKLGKIELFWRSTLGNPGKNSLGETLVDLSIRT